MVDGDYLNLVSFHLLEQRQDGTSSRVPASEIRVCGFETGLSEKLARLVPN